MSSRARVSAIIPCYNATRTLPRAIESVLRQTVPVHEIIAVDDGSRDGTWDLIQSYGKTVTGLRQANAGPSAARNHAARHATGDWIAYLDSDDEWLPTKTELQLSALTANPSLHWCGANVEVVEPDHVERVQLSAKTVQALAGHPWFDDYLDAYGLGLVLVPSTILIARTSLEAMNGFDVTLVGPEDTDLWFRLARVSPGFGYVVEPCVRYYSDSPASLSKSANQIDHKIEMIRKTLGRWVDAEPARSSKARRQLRGAAFRILMTAAGRGLVAHPDGIDRGVGLSRLERSALNAFAMLPEALRSRAEGPLRDLHRQWMIRTHAIS